MEGQSKVEWQRSLECIAVKSIYTDNKRVFYHYERVYHFKRTLMTKNILQMELKFCPYRRYISITIACINIAWFYCALIMRNYRQPSYVPVMMHLWYLHFQHTWLIICSTVSPSSCCISIVTSLNSSLCWLSQWDASSFLSFSSCKNVC